MKPKTVCLQGEPGSGKSRMACLTAIHKPVHVIDIDRKVESAAWAEEAIEKGELTYWELKEPIDESNIRARIASLVSKDKPNVMPRGWAMLSELIYKLATDPISMKAGTWFLDSLTLGNEHLKTHIMWLAGRSKYAWDQWNALKIGWMGTFSVVRDLAKENGKDLIVSVHERTVGEPGDRTTGVKTEVIASKDEGISTARIFQGVQDVKVWASIDGAFGELIGAQTDEYYWLCVDTSNKDKPVWKCRVWPDGRRNLRTSFNATQAEFAPDFRVIWK